MAKKNPQKRKVCFIITSFIHYSRNLLILEELQKRHDIELSVAIGGSALLSKYLSKYSKLKELLYEEGFTNIHEVSFNLEGDSAVVKAKTAGLGTVEFANLFDDIKPDIVVVRGDRFEVLSATMAAAYMNIPIAHIEGGDISGSLDESVRHSITKLAQIHFTTNEPARKRVIQMGEDEKYVFNFGSPDIDVVQTLSKSKTKIKKDDDYDLNRTGSGADFDINKDYIMVMYHPVSGDVGKMSENTRKIIHAVYDLNIQTIWFWPNIDAGAEEISHALRVFNDEVKDHKIRFMRYLPPKKFITLLSKAKCLLGNSSAGIKECSYLGVPVVNIGTRQDSRLHDNNVVTVGIDTEIIKNTLKSQIAVGSYPRSDLYLGKNTSKKIADTLATISLYTQKKFYSK